MLSEIVQRRRDNRDMQREILLFCGCQRAEENQTVGSNIQQIEMTVKVRRKKTLRNLTLHLREDARNGESEPCN